MKLELTNNGNILLNCIRTLEKLGFQTERSYGDRCMLALEEAVERYKNRNFQKREDLKFCRNKDLIYRGLDMHLIQLT